MKKFRFSFLVLSLVVAPMMLGLLKYDLLEIRVNPEVTADIRNLFQCTITGMCSSISPVQTNASRASALPFLKVPPNNSVAVPTSSIDNYSTTGMTVVENEFNQKLNSSTNLQLYASNSSAAVENSRIYTHTERKVNFMTARSARRNDSRGHGYVLSVKYSGQLAAGVLALLSLQCWTRDVCLPMYLVEPFIHGSYLGMFNDQISSIQFGDMFDLGHFNNVSHYEGLHRVVSWDTYATSSSGKAVLVLLRVFPKSKTGPIPPPEIVWTAQSSSSEECSNMTFDKVFVNNKTLCYVRVVTAFYRFQSKETISPTDLWSLIVNDLELDGITLVFQRWRGPWSVTKPLLTSSCTYHNASNNMNTNRTILRNSLLLSKMLRDSPRLLRDIATYQKRYISRSVDSPYVAVMMRAEHAVLKGNRGNRLQNKLNVSVSVKLSECLKKSIAKANTAMAKLDTHNVFVTADTGRFGSTTWKPSLNLVKAREGELEKIEMQVKGSVERLYNHELSFEQWENSFSDTTGGLENRGYIAALQKGLASRASCLILVGGGNFQSATVWNYRNVWENDEERRNCIYYVCAEKMKVA